MDDSNATPTAGDVTPVADKPMEVGDANFQAEAVDASKTIPVFMDVHAVWCQPCKAIEPIVNKFAREDFKGKVKFVKLDADANPETIQKFGIRSIPTLMVFVNGEVKVQQPGALSEPMMKDFINTYAFGGASSTATESSMPMAA